VLGYVAGSVLPYLWPALRISGDKYRLTMLASMALLLVGWTMLLFLKENKYARPPQIRQPSLKMKPSKAVLKFTLITLIIGSGSGMIVPYFNVYFTQIVHASVFATGLVFAVASLFMVAGFVAIPWLSTRVGRARSAVITQVASLPFLLLLAVTGNFLIASVAYTMRMPLMNMAMPAMTSLQTETIRPRGARLRRRTHLDGPEPLHRCRHLRERDADGRRLVHAAVPGHPPLLRRSCRAPVLLLRARRMAASWRYSQHARGRLPPKNSMPVASPAPRHPEAAKD
jgi:hypothetical protein